MLGIVMSTSTIHWSVCVIGSVRVSMASHLRSDVPYTLVEAIREPKYTKPPSLTRHGRARVLQAPLVTAPPTTHVQSVTHVYVQYTKDICKQFKLPYDRRPLSGS